MFPSSDLETPLGQGLLRRSLDEARMARREEAESAECSTSLLSQLDKQTYCAREETEVEKAVKGHWNDATTMLQRIAKTEEVEMVYIPESLKGAVFCGHLVADMDSIAGAIGAAELYGGTPARASAINGETEFGLHYWGYDLDDIKPIEEVLASDPDHPVCLVDFQQKTQLHPNIKPKQVVGVIDHHALQSSTLITERPIYVDIRPWGCMSSILAHNYVMMGKYMPKSVAGLMLSAILSDTLNLRSPTTTEWDRRIMTMLVQYTGVTDVNLLAAQQFRAKSRSLAGMSPHALCAGDVKQFIFTSRGVSIRVAFGVVETTDSMVMIARTAELLPEMRAIRREMSEAQDNKVDCYFLAVVDIVEMQSHLLIAGPKERSLAMAAFGPSTVPLSDKVLSLIDSSAAKNILALKPGAVSRKADFVPPLTKAINDGWDPSQTMASSKSENDLSIGTEVVCVPDTDPSCQARLVRKKTEEIMFED